ncbi:hypothetical protein QWZ08_19665 [Ferruginibacter paludis]|uniref:hypothetical protein n=1 Tax=Ferruginibacter paludis TaxID=1310417 RepID=UPI0025B456C3|nr:hypothetical protein [Ferruginibacter paludis]MDN3657880.1 hypothetical protein [Ferruginibacter paludis]
MKLPINNWTKILLVTAFLAASVIGFMVKLPSGFRHIDKELHAAFYFLAAAFLNVLFAGRKISLHVLIFIFLFLFGIGVEYAQEYSNKLLHVKIHGRFDPEDVQSNLKGLIAFSIVWLVYIVLLFMYNKAIVKQAVSKSE